jgi:hypothetical protein
MEKSVFLTSACENIVATLRFALPSLLQRSRQLFRPVFIAKEPNREITSDTVANQSNYDLY